MATLATLTFPAAEWTGIPLGGVLALFNGKEYPRAYVPERGDVVRFGMRNPREELTAAAGAAGTLAAGDYVLTWVEVDTRQNLGDGITSGPPTGSEGATVTIVAENDGAGSIDVTLPAAGFNAETNAIWIYMTAVDGDWPTLARAATTTPGTTSVTITAAPSGDDFIDYPLDYLRQEVPNKSYPMKMNRRLLLWGSEPLEPTLSLTVGSTYGYWVGGEALDDGCIGMVCYPSQDNRGYVITDFLEGSPGTVVLEDAYVGSGASEATSNVDCKLCRSAGELAWSEPDDYQNFPAANVRYLELASADPETGCAVVNGRGLLFTVRKTFGLAFDQTPALGWGSTAELSTTIGCLSHRSIQDLGGAVAFLADSGIAVSAGGAPQIVSDEIAEEFESIIREETGRCRDAFAVNWAAQQRYLLFVPRAGDSVGCSKAIVMDYRALPGEPRYRFTIYTFNTEFCCGTVERHSVTETADDGSTTTSYYDYPILGDKNGYVWTFGTGNADGPTSGTVSGTVDSATSSPTTMTDSDASFYTSGLGLAGMYLSVRRENTDGTEDTQHVVIASSSADTLRIGQDWDWVPSAGDAYWIGGIESRYETGWTDLGGDGWRKKLDRAICTYHPESSGSATLNVYADFSETALSMTNEGNTVDLDDAEGRFSTKLSGRRVNYAKFRLSNEYPNQPWTLRGLTIVSIPDGEPR